MALAVLLYAMSPQDSSVRRTRAMAFCCAPCRRCSAFSRRSPMRSLFSAKPLLVPQLIAVVAARPFTGRRAVLGSARSSDL
jgi:hypothetical protein